MPGKYPAIIGYILVCYGGAAVFYAFEVRQNRDCCFPNPARSRGLTGVVPAENVWPRRSNNGPMVMPCSSRTFLSLQLATATSIHRAWEGSHSL